MGPIGFIVVGGSWLAFTLLLWRLLFLQRERSGGRFTGQLFSTAAIGGTVFTAWPILPIIFGAEADFGVAFWWFTGFFGAVGGGLWVLLMLEAIIRKPPVES